MFHFNDDNSLTDDTLSDRDRLTLMTHRTRGFVKAMLDDGANGRELVYSLTYTATDFGLYQSENSYHVFPRMLEGIVDATQNVIEDEQSRKQAAASDSNVVKLPLPNSRNLDATPALNSVTARRNTTRISSLSQIDENNIVDNEEYDEDPHEVLESDGNVIGSQTWSGGSWVTVYEYKGKFFVSNEVEITECDTAKQAFSRANFGGQQYDKVDQRFVDPQYDHLFE